VIIVAVRCQSVCITIIQQNFSLSEVYNEPQRNQCRRCSGGGQRGTEGAVIFSSLSFELSENCLRIFFAKFSFRNAKFKAENPNF